MRLLNKTEYPIAVDTDLYALVLKPEESLDIEITRDDTIILRGAHGGASYQAKRAIRELRAPPYEDFDWLNSNIAIASTHISGSYDAVIVMEADMLPKAAFIVGVWDLVCIFLALIFAAIGFIAVAGSIFNRT